VTHPIPLFFPPLRFCTRHLTSVSLAGDPTTLNLLVRSWLSFADPSVGRGRRAVCTLVLLSRDIGSSPRRQVSDDRFSDGRHFLFFFVCFVSVFLALFFHALSDTPGWAQLTRVVYAISLRRKGTLAQRLSTDGVLQLPPFRPLPGVRARPFFRFGPACNVSGPGATALAAGALFFPNLAFCFGIVTPRNSNGHRYRRFVSLSLPWLPYRSKFTATFPLVLCDPPTPPNPLKAHSLL